MSCTGQHGRQERVARQLVRSWLLGDQPVAGREQTETWQQLSHRLRVEIARQRWIVYNQESSVWCTRKRYEEHKGGSSHG